MGVCAGLGVNFIGGAVGGGIGGGGGLVFAQLMIPVSRPYIAEYLRDNSTE